MSGWTMHEGTAVALDRESVDTDQLIPARFMSTPRSEGYGGFLLHDLRFDPGGKPVEAFPLNRVPDASVLVTRRNFGSGSSREAAVYALVDFGIRAVVAPSFGDIFASNAVNNGLLPARVTAEEADALIDRLPETGGPARISLADGIVDIAGMSMSFEIDPIWREKLINGWDDIDLTKNHAAAIAHYRAERAQRSPWALAPGRTSR